MNVIVVGGTGLIGTAFTQSLVTAGHRVWVLSRTPEKARLPGIVEVIKWDGKTGHGWERLVKRADAIVNLAGENIGSAQWTTERKEKIRTSRIDAGTAIVNVLQTCKCKPTVLLQASAVGYYGPSTDKILSETSAPGTDYLSQVAVDWENSSQPVEEMGIRRVVLRTGLVLSTEGGALPSLLLPFRLFAGGPLGSGRQWWSWIHLYDQVQAMRYLLENENAQGIYNLTAPEPVTMEQFGRTLAAVIHKPYLLPAPAFILRMLLGEMSVVVLDGQHVTPNRLLEMGYNFRFKQLRPALENLLRQKETP